MQANRTLVRRNLPKEYKKLKVVNDVNLFRLSNGRNDVCFVWGKRNFPNDMKGYRTCKMLGKVETNTRGVFSFVDRKGGNKNLTMILSSAVTRVIVIDKFMELGFKTVKITTPDKDKSYFYEVRMERKLKDGSVYSITIINQR